MLNLFLPSKKIFLRLFENEIELIDLGNNKSVRRKVDKKFSKRGLLIAEFSVAENELKYSLESLIGKSNFRTIIQMIVHPKIEKEDWLSEVEKRAILELCERVGAKRVLVSDSKETLSVAEARRMLD